jgi:hypothetical protein
MDVKIQPLIHLEVLSRRQLRSVLLGCYFVVICGLALAPVETLFKSEMRDLPVPRACDDEPMAHVSPTAFPCLVNGSGWLYLTRLDTMSLFFGLEVEIQLGANATREESVNLVGTVDLWGMDLVNASAYAFRTSLLHQWINVTEEARVTCAMGSRCAQLTVLTEWEVRAAPLPPPCAASPALTELAARFFST